MDGHAPTSAVTPTPRPERRGMLTRERERELLRAYAERADPSALAELVEAHMPLVRRIAHHHRLRTLRDEDLIAEGTIGLLEAARRFDPKFDARFATYAAHWVRVKVQEHVAQFRRIVPPPDTRAGRRILARRARADAQLTQTLGRAPTPEELAAAIGVSVGDYRDVRGCFETHDVPIGGDGDEGCELRDAMASTEDVVAAAEESHLRRTALACAVEALPSRERKIVLRRRLAADPAPLDTLARELSLSRERVRQLELQAVSMLGRALAPLAA